MNTDDIRLFESVNSLRFLKRLFEPEENKEEYADICSKVETLLEELESVSK